MKTTQIYAHTHQVMSQRRARGEEATHFGQSFQSNSRRAPLAVPDKPEAAPLVRLLVSSHFFPTVLLFSSSSSFWIEFLDNALDLCIDAANFRFAFIAFNFVILFFTN